MGKAQEMVQATQPHCEICGGHLAGGALTVVADNQAMIICLKCVNNGMDYYIRERKKALKSSK